MQQTETSLMAFSNTNSPKFPYRIGAKDVHNRDKAVQYDLCFVNIGFILNVTTLIIWITNIFKTVMNPGTANNVTARSFLLTPYLIAPALIAVLCYGKD